MAKLYENQEQMAIGDGLTIYLREKYPNAPLKHFGSPQTIQWGECILRDQILLRFMAIKGIIKNNRWE